MRKIISLSKGLLTYLYSSDALMRIRGTGGTDSAEYCYGVWMKHLTFLCNNGMLTVPKTMIELGPGDSLGIGLAAMLSGVDHYYALDVVKFANKEKNIKIFDDLIRLFKSRSPLHSKGWPDFNHLLDNKLFPGQILTHERLNNTLSEKRIALIRNALMGISPDQREITIDYIVPWNTKSILNRGCADLILSHAVMEYVKDLDYAYEAMYYWLREGGFISHQVDFRSHGLSKKWNGHWVYSERAWKVIEGKKPFIINRQPYSVHHDLISKHGFKLIMNEKSYSIDGYKRHQLSDLWKKFSDDDLTCSGAFVQAVKPHRNISN